MALEYNTYVRMNSFKNEVVLGNEHTGFWIKLTKECYDLINGAINRKLDKDQLISELYDKEDQIYIIRIIEMLQETGILKGSPEYRENFDRKVTFGITSKCNLNCIHCSVSAACTNEDYFSDSQLFEIADNIIDYNPNTIVITGGEPLMRNNFLEITKYFRRNFKGKLLLMTNATQIGDKEAASIASNYDAVATSLDGYDEKTSDFIRGHGTFKKTCNAIKLLKAYGVKNLSVSMILGGNNCNTIDRFRELNYQLGTRPVFRILTPIGRAEKNYDLLTKSEESSFLWEPKKVKSQTEGKARLVGQFSVCSGIASQFCISPNGNIYPCAGAQIEDFSLGNVWEVGNFRAFFDDKLYINSMGYRNFMSIMPKEHEKCKSCNYSIHCISCPVYIYSYEKKGLLAKYCKIQKEKISKSYKYV